MSDTTITDAINLILLSHDQPVGTLQIAQPNYAAAESALKQAGYTIQPVAQVEDQMIEYGEECTVEDPRPCEINIASGRIAYLAKESGASPDLIEDIFAKKLFTEDEIRSAAKATISSMSEGEYRSEALMFYEATYGSDDGLAHE